MSVVCFHCGHQINGMLKTVVPPKFAEAWGDFPKSYHPECHTLAENKAEEELIKGQVDRNKADGIEKHIDRLVTYANNLSAKYFADNKYVLTPPMHRADYISDKWCRIVVLEKRGEKWESTSVYCFVCLMDNTTRNLGTVTVGDIHKASSFKVPAKHKRGSVFHPDFNNCMTTHGIVSLK